MKEVECIKLYFREGSSDKVYEVDLVEVAPDRCVVNFRYGRRGAVLREGSKTEQPVSYESAKEAYDKLVASKVKKGYSALESMAGAQISEAVAEDPRVAAVLARLKRGDDKAADWALSRAIWRAGELGIEEASPLLINLFNGSDIRDYCVIWALGRCGGLAAREKLQSIWQDLEGDIDQPRDRMTALALMQVLEGAAKKAFQSVLAEQLPKDLQALLGAGAYADILTWIQHAEDSRTPLHSKAIEVLYVLAMAELRSGILQWLNTAPLRPNVFVRIRHIFKASEFRSDAEVFGLLSKRFETTRAMYSRPDHMWNGRFYVQLDNGQYKTFKKDESKKADSKLAYSSQTRWYLRKRCWRSLRRLGELEQPEYVKMAVGALFLLEDADAQVPESTCDYAGHETWWGRYSRYYLFNSILFGNSPRFENRAGSKSWSFRTGFNPQSPIPSVREESFPQLWDRQPNQLLELILKSRCLEVHEFAVRALRCNSKYVDSLAEAELIKILRSPYEVSALFGFEHCEAALSSPDVSTELVLALVECVHAPARLAACEVVQREQLRFRRDIHVLTALLISPFSDVQDQLMHLFGLVELEDEVAADVLCRVVDYLVKLEAADEERARTVATTVVKALEAKLGLIEFRVIEKMLAHPVLPVQELGADILVKHNLPAAEIPERLLELLLNSEHESLRAFAVRIIGQFNDAELLARQDLLSLLASHRLADIRSLIRPVVKRLADAHPEFAVEMVNRLIKTLIRGRLGDDWLNDLARVLKEDLCAHMEHVETDTVWSLLRVKSTAAQDVGGHLLYKVDAHALDLSQIVELGSHEIRSVREAAWNMFEADLERIRQDMPLAVKMLDAEWEDSRMWAADFFMQRLERNDFSPESLVSICDSVRPDVQQFGRKLLVEHFESEDGVAYLVQLSEHPSVDMQLFVTGFMEVYASGSLEHFEALMPFFKSGLSRIQKGRVARKRMLSFIEQEALADARVAKLAVDLLGPYTASASIEVRATCLQALVRIKRKYPTLQLPEGMVMAGGSHAV